MKGDKGICQFFDDGELILRTKFDTQKNCQARIETLLHICATKPNTQAYKCKECGFWHSGDPMQNEKYKQI